MKVYLKLRSDLWLVITKKIEQVTITKKKKTTRYILAGESTDNPVISEKYVSIRVPRGVVNKVISKLLDLSEEGVAIIEPISPEQCLIKVPRNNCSLIESVVKELLSNNKMKRAKIEESKETS
ncbi:MAG: hypothetical protein QXE81_05680 [Desulfurococcaceae archaeon]